jgi:hypothetical protein
MSKSIVITSIFEPTPAVKKFAKLDDYSLIVVGDRKTPINWQYDNVTYLSIAQQDSSAYKLATVLPYNHYCRKMLGYLHAIANKASQIVDTDDDNIPKDNWNFPIFEDEFDYLKDNQGFINIYQLFTQQAIWPRGLPLTLITKNFALEKTLIRMSSRVGIWQGLADEDPDVDAIYRLTSDVTCYFDTRSPVVLGKGTIAPFNTQNTLIRNELFPLLYLPTSVTFRFTDILRGLIAQPIMWLYDFHLGFTDASVIQKRNPHDYQQDFISEIPMYQHCEKVIDIVQGSISCSQSLKNNLYNAYVALLKARIVTDEEMRPLNAWLEDLQLINDQ